MNECVHACMNHVMQPAEELSADEKAQRDHHEALMQRILAKLVALDQDIEARLTTYGSAVNRSVN